MPNDLLELPEYRANPFISRLPALAGLGEAFVQLTELPVYNESERHLPSHIRLHLLPRLTRYFDPNERHLDLCNRLEMLIYQGYVGRNPLTTSYIRHLNAGADRIEARKFIAASPPAESTASGIALIGVSGMGKTKSLEHILRRYTPQTHVHDDFNGLHQILWLRLDCPSKGSPKQLCTGFFQELDRLLMESNYEAKYGGGRTPLDTMLLKMAALANRHALGLLVVDEIQHLIEARGTDRAELLNFFVTLVNMVGVPVVLVGTPRALPLLDGAFRQARRASGLGSIVWDRLPKDATWNDFIERMWRYQWTREQSVLTDEIRETLYDESQGIVDIVIKLYVLAQLKAIQLGELTGQPEIINATVLRSVSRESLGLIHPMIDALRRDDKRALDRYDDLAEFDRYAKQILADAAAVGRPKRLPVPPTASPRIEPQDPDPSIIGFLATLGIADDVAALLIAEIRSEIPGIEPIELVQTVKTRIEARNVPAQTSKKRRRPAKPSTPIENGDIRNALSASEGGRYHWLQMEGFIKPPLDDVGNL